MQLHRDDRFFHIHGGLWSGDWSYRKFPNERPEVKNSHACPIGGCMQQYCTDHKMKEHYLRLQGGAAHDRYRKNNCIQYGPTPEENAASEAKLDAIQQRHKREKRGDLLKTVYDGSSGLPDYTGTEIIASN